MGALGIVLLALGLSMDAFAVALCKGMTLQEPKVSHFFTIGAWFGSFQGIMPLLGAAAGKKLLPRLPQSAGNWICFSLFLLIAAGMLKDALRKNDRTQGDLSFFSMLPAAVATSLDAFSAGLAYSLQKPALPLPGACLLIGATTFVLSGAGALLGGIASAAFRKRSLFFGAFLLFLLALHALTEALGVSLPF